MLRDILAEQFDRVGESALATRVRDGSDNSKGGEAAIAAMVKLAEQMSMRPERRVAVFNALDGEREYQEDRKRSEGYVGENHEHELAAYITFMDDYLREAKTIVSRDWSRGCPRKVLNVLRKVTALGVAAMEAHGVVRRGDAV
jgi:hypothetical protein